MKFQKIAKKVLSIVLVVSLLSILGVGSIMGNAAQNQNSLVDTFLPSWGFFKHNKTIEETTDSRYGDYAILNKTVGYQNLYTSLETNPNELYNVKFSIKANAINRIEIFAVQNGAEIPWASGGALASNSTILVDYKVYKNFVTSETEWTDISIEFETVETENVQYYMNILFGAGGTSNTATVSDFSLVKIEKTTWLQYRWNTSITRTTDSRYGGYAILNKTVASQNLYTSLETNTNELYNVKFSVKANAINRIEVFALPEGEEVPWASSGALNSSSGAIVDYKSFKNYTTSETEWTDISIEFETVETENVQYYMNILFGAGGTSNTATVSDFVVSKIEEINWLQHKWNTSITRTTDSRYGGYAIYNTKVAYQNLYTELKTEPGNIYTATFSVKANEVKRVEIFAVPNGVELPWASGGALDSASESISVYLPPKKGLTTSETEWTDVSFAFETIESSDVQYYINILFGDGGTSNAATVSDFSLSKINIPNVDEFMAAVGNSIRTTGTQALRYKFNVEKSSLAKQYDGYTITEYGYLAICDEYLTEQYGELTFTFDELTNSKSIRGVAYQAGVEDVVFSETDTTKTISAALFNIGTSKRTNYVDYSFYSKSYTVRPYVIFEDPKGNKFYKYGTTCSATVFDTMHTILALDEQMATEKGYDWQTVQQDQEAINDILDSVANDADESTELTVGDYYNLYLRDNKAE